MVEDKNGSGGIGVRSRELTGSGNQLSRSRAVVRLLPLYNLYYDDRPSSSQEPLDIVFEFQGSLYMLIVSASRRIHWVTLRREDGSIAA